MNHGYVPNPSWPANNSVQQPAAGQYPWYAHNSNSMQPAMQLAVQEEPPPLPAESPPPLPDEPPPPPLPQQYSQQNGNINMGPDSMQGSYMQQWGQHPMQPQYSHVQYSQSGWQNHVMGMPAQQHWAYGVPEQPGALASGGQQPVLSTPANQHSQYYPQHNNNQWQYPQQHPVPYQWQQQPLLQQQYQSSTSIGQQPPPPPRPPLPAVTAASSSPLPTPMQHTSPAAVAPPTVPSVPPAPEPVDLKQLLLPPGRNQRPKRLLLILRGLPGCGKSHIARTIKQSEVANGGSAPRVHSLDDYFMVDLEREVAADTAGAVKSAGSKRRVMIEQEYQHDATMEDSYWRSLLKALGKTLSSGGHSLVLLDAPCPRADQVKEAWLLGESVGYEVMVVEPLVTDPEECHRQNVHGRSLSDIRAMAAVYEPAPSLYTRADASTLFSATSSAKMISDVDMAVEDAATESEQQGPAVASAARSRWETDDAEDAEGTAGREQQQQGTASRAEAADITRRSPADNSSPDTVASQHHAADSDVNRPAKRLKSSVSVTASEDGLDIDNEALLAGVNQALEQLDAEEAAAAARDVGGAGAGDVDAVPGHKTAGDAAGLATASSMSLGGSHTSANSKGGILKGASTPGSLKKKVTWPDLPQEEEQQSGFRIAPVRRQLEEVYWVDGLGPPKTLWLGGGVLAGCADDDEDPDAGVGGELLQLGAGREQQQVAVHQSVAKPVARSASAAMTGYHRHSSFAEQVRAEHKSEHDLFRAVLLGQVHTKPSKSHLS